MEEISLIGSTAYSLISIEATTMPDRNLLQDLIDERNVISIKSSEYVEVEARCESLRRI
jgi:hypothetical protein